MIRAFIAVAGQLFDLAAYHSVMNLCEMCVTFSSNTVTAVVTMRTITEI